MGIPSNAPALRVMPRRIQYGVEAHMCCHVCRLRTLYLYNVSLRRACGVLGDAVRAGGSEARRLRCSGVSLRGAWSCILKTIVCGEAMSVARWWMTFRLGLALDCTAGGGGVRVAGGWPVGLHARMCGDSAQP